MIEIQTDKKVYFASDFHLGVPNLEESQQRERRIVQWLKEIQTNVGALFLLGDLFDTWMEYKHVVPKGYIRLLGALADYADAGIPIYIFSGNHDVWMRDYFIKELNAKIYHKEQVIKINDTLFEIGHGDGLGPKDRGYKILKFIMRNSLAQWIYRRFHPNFGIGLASYLSQLGPKHQTDKENIFLGPEKEWIIQHCEEQLKKYSIQYFIFGHRHLPIEFILSNNKSVYINLGDWINYNSYVCFEKGKATLKYFQNEK